MSRPIGSLRRRLAAPLLLALLIGLPVPLRAGSAEVGTVWRVRDRAGTVYLAGSLHQLRQADAALPSPYGRAYAEAERLVMELDLDDLDATVMAGDLMQRALMPPDRSLRRLVGPSRWQRLQSPLAALGLPEELLDRLEPWAAALLLASAGLARDGYSPAGGVEGQLLQRARADRKPVEGLETVALQLELFDGLSLPEQLAMLDTTLADLEKLPDRLADLEGAWRRGDLATLERQLPRGAGGRAPELERFVTRRNLAWLPRIKALLGRPDDTMVVVGALHLLGDQGLVELLRRQGLQVERLGAL